MESGTLIPESRDGQYADVKEKAKKLLLGGILIPNYTISVSGDRDRWEEGELEPDQDRIAVFRSEGGITNLVTRWMQQQPSTVIAYTARWSEERGTFTMVPMEKAK